MTKQAGRMKRVLVAAMFLIVAISIGKPMQTQAAQQPVSVTKCKLSANKKTLTVKAKVKKKTGAMGSKLYLVGLGAHAKEAGKVSTVPLANVKAKKGTITFSQVGRVILKTHLCWRRIRDPDLRHHLRREF